MVVVDASLGVSRAPRGSAGEGGGWAVETGVTVYGALRVAPVAGEEPSLASSPGRHPPG
ncbi:hypothetical protein Pyrfu_1184 [Pyrolobus fumarii 1A]|uniref:Uncharacterized protein n=1 Tax=Pyrolobus fumarii (strain DSM 11204 / 1A) TaxID=694429 RepID=G0EFU6_PYRF1|nr:hypothetical protein Pyrfu_1184 [Pyrolobus fumarii 1A]